MTKILIVDDEDSIRENLRSLLSSKGYECIEASSYREFCDIIELIEYGEEPPVDLILLDHHLPPFCGWELLEEVRKNYGNNCCRGKFIVCTANPDINLNRSYQLLGSLNHIVKPYNSALNMFWNTIDAALIDPRRDFYQGYAYYDNLSNCERNDLRAREFQEALTLSDYDLLFSAATKWSIYYAENNLFSETANILNSLNRLFPDTVLSNTNNLEKYFDVYESLLSYIHRSEMLENIMIAKYIDFGYRAIDNFYFRNQSLSEIIKSIRLFLLEYSPSNERELAAYQQEHEERRKSVTNDEKPSEILLAPHHCRIGLAGGDPGVRKGIIEYFSDFGNFEFVEVPPSNEASIQTNYLRDRLQGCDLIVLITTYMGHDLYRNIKSLCKTGRLQSDILIPNFRGSSGISREIKEKILYQLN